eukprot:g30670.t1
MMFRLPKKKKKQNVGKDKPTGSQEAYQTLLKELAERDKVIETNQAKAAAAPATDGSDKKGSLEARAKDKKAAEPARPNPRVFLELQAEKSRHLPGWEGRLEFELRADVVPRTADNFRALCTGEKGGHLWYEGNFFHRIIPGFMAQAGDITDGDGTGGLSIYGESFADENFKLPHDRPGLLSMANSGPNSNGSQFFILFKEQNHLNSKHVVFGHCVKGQQLLRDLERAGSGAGEPKQKVKIARCGEAVTAADSRARRRPASPDRQEAGTVLSCCLQIEVSACTSASSGVARQTAWYYKR